jgi:hypothetical protein
MDGGYLQAEALAQMAGALAEAGLYQQAEAIAHTITIPDWRGTALVQVAEALTKAGDTGPAHRIAAATCAEGRWTTAAKPVLLLEPSASIMLTSAQI